MAAELPRQQGHDAEGAPQRLSRPHTNAESTTRGLHKVSWESVPWAARGVWAWGARDARR